MTRMVSSKSRCLRDTNSALKFPTFKVSTKSLRVLVGFETGQLAMVDRPARRDHSESQFDVLIAPEHDGWVIEFLTPAQFVSGPHEAAESAPHALAMGISKWKRSRGRNAAAESQ